MASAWFYQVTGEQLGPISSAELHNLAQRGTVKRDTRVRKAPDGAWVPAGRVNGLFPVSGTTPPPPPPASATVQPASHTAAVGAENSGPTTTTKVVIGACGAVFMVVVGFIVWFFAIRNTWESDHRRDVIRLSKETMDFDQANDPASAVKKYEELILLVGSRKLAAPDLTEAVSDAGGAAEIAKQKIREQQFISSVRGLDAQAKAFVEVGEFERGIAKYQQALESITNSHIADPELAALARGISQAKTLAGERFALSKIRALEAAARALVDAAEFERGIAKYQDALDLAKGGHFVNSETATAAGRISQAKAVASARVEQNKAERTRIEEGKRIAGIRVKIKGGPWLTKKAGNSETLRGLDIRVLRAPARRQQLMAMLEATLDGNNRRLREERERVGNRKEGENRWALDPRQYVARVERFVALTEERIKQESLKEATSVDMRAIFSVSSRLAGFYSPTTAEARERSIWASICSQQLAAQVHTDVDGKHSVEVPVGDYYLYATFRSSYSEVEWFLPVRVSEAKDIAVDLRNWTFANSQMALEKWGFWGLMLAFWPGAGRLGRPRGPRRARRCQRSWSFRRSCVRP